MGEIGKRKVFVGEDRKTESGHFHQENAVSTFSAFSPLASKKSSTRKYHLLIKRNPLYFLGAFSSFGEIGVAFNKSTLLWKS